MAIAVAQKIGTTQLFNQDGTARVATVLRVIDSYVTQIKTNEKDGYQSVQIGHQKTKKTKPSILSRLKKLSIDRPLNKFLETGLAGTDKKIGDKVTVDFKPEDPVLVIGISKGKGFAGTVKRHHFNTGPKTHGSHNYRQPGSIGSGYPERVVPGKRMAGHLGFKRTTVKGLKVVSLSEDGTITLNGPVPGPRKSFVVIKGHNE